MIAKPLRIKCCIAAPEATSGCAASLAKGELAMVYERRYKWPSYKMNKGRGCKLQVVEKSVGSQLTKLISSEFKFWST